MDAIEHAQARLHDIAAKHTHIALWSSGGKDSLTLMHLAQEHAEQITILHCDMGADGFPGIVDNLQQACDRYGYTRLVVKPASISLDTYIAHFGWPSHLIPADMDGVSPTPWTGPLRVASHWHCTIWRFILPLVQATNDLGADAVLTGTRSSDARLFEQMGQEVPQHPAAAWTRYNPIIEWSTDAVYAYVDAHGIQLPPIYAHKRPAAFEFPDCRLCPWSAGYIAWMREHAPQDFAVLQAKYGPTARALQNHLTAEAAGLALVTQEDSHG